MELPFTNPFPANTLLFAVFFLFSNAVYFEVFADLPTLLGAADFFFPADFLGADVFNSFNFALIFLIKTRAWGTKAVSAFEGDAGADDFLGDFIVID